MDEQQMYSNVVHAMVANFGKFLQDYEEIPTTTDLRLIDNLQSISSTLTRLLRKHKRDVELPCKDREIYDDSSAVNQSHSVPTVKMNDGNIVKQKKVSHESDDEREEVLKKAEMSILKSISDYNLSDDKESRYDESIPHSEKISSVSSSVESEMKDIPKLSEETTVLEDPHLKKITFDTYTCKICHITMSLANALSHVSGKPHRNKAKMLIRESSLNRVSIDKPSTSTDCDYPYIEEVIAHSSYLCKLCKVTISSEQNVKQHVEGAKHKKELSVKQLSPDS